MSAERKTFFQSSGTTNKQALTARWLQECPLTRISYAIPALREIEIVELFAGSACTIRGHIGEIENRLVASVDNFWVPPPFQKKGIGQRLFRGFLQTSMEKGAKELWSDEVSNQALRLRAKLLGASSSHFFDTDHPDMDEVPISIDQVQLSNDRVEEIWQQLDEDDPVPSHFGIKVNLGTLNTSGWEALRFVDRASPLYPV